MPTVKFISPASLKDGEFVLSFVAIKFKLSGLDPWNPEIVFTVNTDELVNDLLPLIVWSPVVNTILLSLEFI